MRETASDAIRRIQRELDFFPEPGRRKVGYSANDCYALLLAVMRKDRPTRAGSEDLGTQQSWSWLERESGIPARTIERILRDYVFLGKELGTSPLSRAATHAGVRIQTEARSRILTATLVDPKYAQVPRLIDSNPDYKPDHDFEQKSAHTSNEEGQIPSTLEIEEEVNEHD
jgi:hypothetical protein